MFTKDENLNANKNKNFENAVSLFETKLTQNDIFEYLSNGNTQERQICALKLEKIENNKQALILANNLIGCDGKIREAVSFKINELTENYEILQYFFQTKIYDIFFEAIIDVNGNICRNIISTVNRMKSNDDFCRYFIKNLIQRTKSLVDIVKKFDFTDGRYKINKEAFKLYWYLETIYEFADKIPVQELKSIILQTKDINEYTIREKTAKILSKLNNSVFDAVKSELINDKNYYVRFTMDNRQG